MPNNCLQICKDQNQSMPDFQHSYTRITGPVVSLHHNFIISLRALAVAELQTKKKLHNNWNLLIRIAVIFRSCDRVLLNTQWSQTNFENYFYQIRDDRKKLGSKSVDMVCERYINITCTIPRAPARSKD